MILEHVVILMGTVICSGDAGNHILSSTVARKCITWLEHISFKFGDTRYTFTHTHAYAYKHIDIINSYIIMFKLLFDCDCNKILWCIMELSFMNPHHCVTHNLLSWQNYKYSIRDWKFLIRYNDVPHYTDK